VFPVTIDIKNGFEAPQTNEELGGLTGAGSADIPRQKLAILLLVAGPDVYEDHACKRCPTTGKFTYGEEHMHKHFQACTKSVWFVLAGLLIVAECSSAQAVRVNVPFEFTVGSVAMPAGTYSIDPESDSEQAMDLIWGMDRSTARAHDYFSSRPIEVSGRKNETDLVFRCFDRECFLSQVWMAGNHTGRQLSVQIPSRLTAKGAPPPRELVVAALR
jgi:hypothetical protein